MMHATVADGSRVQSMYELSSTRWMSRRRNTASLSDARVAMGEALRGSAGRLFVTLTDGRRGR